MIFKFDENLYINRQHIIHLSISTNGQRSGWAQLYVRMIDGGSFSIIRQTEVIDEMIKEIIA